MSAVPIISASLLHQKDSALTKWFRSRTENARATRKAIRLDDILIIAAYNAQVFQFKSAFPTDESEPSINSKVRRPRLSSTPSPLPAISTPREGWNFY